MCPSPETALKAARKAFSELFENCKVEALSGRQPAAEILSEAEGSGA
jgi:hypothetical protein